MKVDDCLEGASNFIPWKYRFILLLEEKHLLQFVKEKVLELEVEEDKPRWRKDDAKARRILVDSVRDHLVPQILEKTTMRRMFKTLKKLFEHSSINMTLTLRNQLSNMKMMKSEDIASYFMRITELQGKLKSNGENLEEKDLDMTTLNGLPPS